LPHVASADQPRDGDGEPVFSSRILPAPGGAEEALVGVEPTMADLQAEIKAGKR
jgi:hypothetical protein